MKYTELESDLSLLELDGNPETLPTLKILNSRFRKLALKFHPDKGGDTAMMQQLSQAFQRLSTYISENTNCDQADKDENSCLREFFQKFNNIQLNTQSTTIFLENKFTEAWNTILTGRYGSPVISNTGKIWSFSYGQFKKITVSIWSRPKSDGKTKLLVQGKGYLNFTYQHLPILYQKVTELSVHEKSPVAVSNLSIKLPRSSVKVLRSLGKVPKSTKNTPVIRDAQRER